MRWTRLDNRIMDREVWSNDTTVRLLVYLSVKADRTGYLTCSLNTLSSELKVSIGSIRNSLAMLVKLNVISINNSNRTLQFRILCFSTSNKLNNKELNNTISTPLTQDLAQSSTQDLAHINNCNSNKYNTPLAQSSTQDLAQDLARNNIYIDNKIIDNNINLINTDEILNFLISDKIWVEQAIIVLKEMRPRTETRLIELITEFVNNQLAYGRQTADVKQVRQHFINFARKYLRNEKEYGQRINRTGGRNGRGQQDKEQRDAEFAEFITKKIASASTDMGGGD